MQFRSGTWGGGFDDRAMRLADIQAKESAANRGDVLMTRDIK